MSESKAFLIKGADGETVSIKAGDYYFNTKARIRRMMQNSLSPEARRVYACLELATMGFQQEKAVIKDGGRIRPLTPSDVSQQTGLSKQNTRRAIVELEDTGLAERRGTDEGPLHKGKVELFSWSVPRAPKAKNGSQRATTIPKWFPDSWAPLKPLITRLKLVVSIDEETARDYLSDGATAARDYQNAEMVVKNFLERVCAQGKNGRIREITERTRERTPSSSSVTVEAKAETATTTVDQTPSEEQDPQQPPPLSDSEIVENALGFDADAARRLLAATRKVKPSITAAEIAELALAKIYQVKGQLRSGKIENVVGFLIAAIPKMVIPEVAQGAGI